MFSLLNVVMASDSFFGTLLPENWYSPDVGLSNADKQLRSVVFPEPDGPRSMILSPSFISKSTPSRALTVSEAIW